ncbi:kinase-like protein [Trematosphaeria pertusa]|uniref:Kinase-like protein n=1 Tax=Trematosphaeria pertusa TaxID=390896 RepID=A0A6A6HS29_9PLEO|nr:kinase-like protein [Trematosphaeria pertusa]KAF2240906.1 kinase-like protein [Trematosphaeria pertusa]
MSLLCDALRGLQFLHSQSYIHRDVKPQNISMYANHAVLLDLGSATRLSSPTATLSATPGRFGTIEYLAPEFEKSEYGTAADVWALGVSAFELLYRYHPFRHSKNPWRAGAEYLQPAFRQQEQMAVQLLRSSKDGVGGVILRMLRYQWSEINSAMRISATRALEFPCWDALDESYSPPRKLAKK